MESISIVTIVERYVHLEQKGKEFIGLCPFHQENTPSFFVNPDKNLFYCFGCRASGNSIQFLMQIESISYPQALQMLQDKFGLSSFHPATQTDYEHKKQCEHIYQEIQKTLQAQFWAQEEKHMAYFQKRHISKDVVKEYGIGYALGSEWSEEKEKALSFSTGLFYQSKGKMFPFFRQMYTFPFQISSQKQLDSRRMTVGFGGKPVMASKIKYIHSPETLLFHKRKFLFGSPQAWEACQKEKKVFLMEGYFDVLHSASLGIQNILGLLGSSFTADHLDILKRNPWDIILALDKDEAGILSTEKAILLGLSQGIQFSIWDYPVGKDPDEYFHHEQKIYAEHIVPWEKILERLWSRLSSQERKYKMSLLKKSCQSLDALDKIPILEKIGNMASISLGALLSEPENISALDVQMKRESSLLISQKRIQSRKKQILDRSLWEMVFLQILYPSLCSSSAWNPRECFEAYPDHPAVSYLRKQTQSQSSSLENDGNPRDISREDIPKDVQSLFLSFQNRKDDMAFVHQRLEHCMSLIQKMQI